MCVSFIHTSEIIKSFGRIVKPFWHLTRCLKSDPRLFYLNKKSRTNAYTCMHVRRTLLRSACDTIVHGHKVAHVGNNDMHQRSLSCSAFSFPLNVSTYILLRMYLLSTSTNNFALLIKYFLILTCIHEIRNALEVSLPPPVFLKKLDSPRPKHLILCYSPKSKHGPCTRII